MRVGPGGKKKRLVHRIAAAIWLGFDLESDLQVNHHCDNPPCFNPEHLFIGTQKDNLRDMDAKGRRVINHAPRVWGERHPSAKLSIADVLAIKVATGSQQVVADRFGITQSTVSKIKRGERWSHVIIETQEVSYVT